MHIVTDPSVETTASNSAAGKPRSSRRLTKPLLDTAVWLSERLAPPPPPERPRSHRLQLAVACAGMILLSGGVRLLHWQDSHLSGGLEMLTQDYLKNAEQILDGGGILFPPDLDEPTNVHLLGHPPGYSIFIATIFGLVRNSSDTLTVVQIIADGVSAVMVTMIGAELFPLAVGVLAGLLVAFSPHLARYAIFLLPDSLSALPILIAIYLVILSVKRPLLATVVAAGCSLGLSCWLRSNALLLPLLVALALWFLLERGKRLRYSPALFAAAVITISPITIRNWMVFHHFIPLSLGAGVTVIEGIADYDTENRFGMPVTDTDSLVKDIEWHSRPDYGENLWMPDGIERDRYRFGRGCEVVRQNPVWFAGVMIRRAGFMLSYNSSVSRGWPFDTARVAAVAPEPSFGHHLADASGTRLVWTTSAAALVANGQLARQAEVSLSADGRRLEVAGDTSEFGDQIASEPIAVERNTDYILRLPARLVQGRVAAKVTSVDRGIMLGARFIVKLDEAEARVQADATEPSTGNKSETNYEEEISMPTFDIPFASGNQTEVLFVVSNNGESSARSTSQIGRAELYKIGPTPHIWTRIVRPPTRWVQTNLYTTSRMLPLIVTGILLLAFVSYRAPLLILLIVPVYYLGVQSVFHTEYRYILPMHYFLFTITAVTLYCAGHVVGQAVHWLAARLPFGIRSGL